MGLPEARARDSAALARRSLGALRRKIAIDSGILVPEWSKPEVARFLIPVLLAGIWDKEKYQRSRSNCTFIWTRILQAARESYSMEL